MARHPRGLMAFTDLQMVHTSIRQQTGRVVCLRVTEEASSCEGGGGLCGIYPVAPMSAPACPYVSPTHRENRGNKFPCTAGTARRGTDRACVGCPSCWASCSFYCTPSAPYGTRGHAVAASTAPELPGATSAEKTTIAGGHEADCVL